MNDLQAGPYRRAHNAFNLISLSVANWSVHRAPSAQQPADSIPAEVLIADFRLTAQSADTLHRAGKRRAFVEKLPPFQNHKVKIINYRDTPYLRFTPHLVGYLNRNLH